MSIKREELLKPKETQEYTRICYIITYHPRNPNMKEILQQHIHILAKMRKNPITNEQIQTFYKKIKKSERFTHKRHSQPQNHHKS